MHSLPMDYSMERHSIILRVQFWRKLSLLILSQLELKNKKSIKLSDFQLLPYWLKLSSDYRLREVFLIYSKEKINLIQLRKHPPQIKLTETEINIYINKTKYYHLKREEDKLIFIFSIIEKINSSFLFIF